MFRSNTAHAEWFGCSLAVPMRGGSHTRIAVRAGTYMYSVCVYIYIYIYIYICMHNTYVCNASYQPALAFYLHTKQLSLETVPLAKSAHSIFPRFQTENHELGSKKHCQSAKIPCLFYICICI